MSLKTLTGGLLAAAATAALAQSAPPPPAPQQAWGQARPAETRAQVIQRTQALFQRLDRNHDGFITQDEIATLGERGGDRPAPPPPGAGPDHGGDMFARMDTNHDGVISRAEFDQAHAAMRGMHHGERNMGAMAGGPGDDHGMGGEHGMRGRMLMMADTNHDGRITLQELTAAALQRFDRADLNHDGTVTPEERAQAHQQWGARPRG